MHRLASQLDERLRTLVRDGLVVAFSGGVDSAFLLWAAERARREVGGRLLALTSASESTPSWDFADATRFAAHLGVEHQVERSEELSHAEYAQNGSDRCYHCKAELFRIAERLRSERDLRWVAYGYTDSDRSDVRPGHRAALEQGVVSPLAEAGLGKEDIRELMREHGIELADKSASPCLASRVMTGLPITTRRLSDVEALEGVLRRGGVVVNRVRVCEAGADDRFLRIEVAPDEMATVLPLRDELVREGRARGYRWVTLDLQGYRSGGGTEGTP